MFFEFNFSDILKTRVEINLPKISCSCESKEKEDHLKTEEIVVESTIEPQSTDTNSPDADTASLKTEKSDK